MAMATAVTSIPARLKLKGARLDKSLKRHNERRTVRVSTTTTNAFYLLTDISIISNKALNASSNNIIVPYCTPTQQSRF